MTIPSLSMSSCPGLGTSGQLSSGSRTPSESMSLQGSQASPMPSLSATTIDEIVAHRDRAREAREWVVADQIRDRLAAHGITIEDGVDGTRWHRS